MSQTIISKNMENWVIHELRASFTNQILDSQLSWHIYWVGATGESEDEREQKRLSILNHIVNIHQHANHKIFK